MSAYRSTVRTHATLQSAVSRSSKEWSGAAECNLKGINKTIEAQIVSQMGVGTKIQGFLGNGHRG